MRRDMLWELVMDVKVRGSLDCSDHEMVEFKMLKERRKTYSRTKILNFRRRLRGVQVGRIPWVAALGTEEPRRAGQFSRTAFSKHRSYPSPCTRQWASIAWGHSS